MTKMSDNDIKHAIEHHEFADTIIAAAPAVAVVLTQSWCHQWHDMRAWLGSSAPPPRAVTVFYYEYDITDLFDSFREFKERHWQNDQVPYIRYYRDRVCVHESNFCSEADFYRSFAA